MLECVVNISAATGLEPLTDAAGDLVLDVHSDIHHNRSVVTLAGRDADLWDAVTALATVAVRTLDIRTHQGVHPRIGVVDVVPWVDLDDPWAVATSRSRSVRDRFATWAESTLQVPCRVYGPERSLPDIRRQPGPLHPTAGAIAVGARGVLIAYNLWIDGSVDEARRIAGEIRQPGLRTLGLQVGDGVQVSCNLTDPSRLTVAEVYSLVAASAAIRRAELVGLIPEALVDERHGLTPDQTIESRLRR